MDRRLQKNHAKAVRRNIIKSERAAAEAARHRLKRAAVEDTELVVTLTAKGRREFAHLSQAETAGAASSDE